MIKPGSRCPTYSQSRALLPVTRARALNLHEILAPISNPRWDRDHQHPHADIPIQSSRPPQGTNAERCWGVPAAQGLVPKASTLRHDGHAPSSTSPPEPQLGANAPAARQLRGFQEEGQTHAD